MPSIQLEEDSGNDLDKLARWIRTPQSVALAGGVHLMLRRSINL